MCIDVHLITGNHDCYYKNTNNVNAVDLLLREYDNVTVYSEPTEVMLGQLPTLFIPWINQEMKNALSNLFKRHLAPVRWATLNFKVFV